MARNIEKKIERITRYQTLFSSACVVPTLTPVVLEYRDTMREAIRHIHEAKRWTQFGLSSAHPSRGSLCERRKTEWNTSVSYVTRATET